MPWGAVALFVGVSFGLAWLIALPLWLRDPSDPTFTALFGPLAQAIMFTPALATLVALFIARTPRGERLRFLGMWPLRPAKRIVWFMIGAVFAPVVIVAGSVAIAAVLGWLEVDLVGFSGFAEQLEASLPESAAAMLPPTGLIVALQLLAIPLGAVFNCIFTFGEEIGWRGWLLPALRPLGTWPALILSGAIWGLWHAPLILLGYNFGLTDWRGVALMVIGCVAWGILLGWSRLRTGSVWPAVIAHGALNASAAIFLLGIAAGFEPNPVLVVPVGVAGWIAVAIVIVMLVLTGQFSADRQPELAPARGAQAIQQAPLAQQGPQAQPNPQAPHNPQAPATPEQPPAA
ncbi:CAAX prenyl protease-like protein [Leucobacter luti]|uniref:CAAX prenyl protease-like protein n=1 Tax=Leucobacter luti TaxID=340320 RepID=A0A4R6S8U2_9MICO|nr:CPBP family intramembrane glutamic endopeptidase [Leucobacter luti]TDP95853.1 CAAX prenyl protease-like protein [Leucobacter luti]